MSGKASFRWNTRPRRDPFDGKDPEMAGFFLLWQPDRRTDWKKSWAQAREGPGQVNELALGDEVVVRSVLGWEGLTPAIVQRLAPDFVTDEERAGMESDLAGSGLDSFPFSADLLRDLADHSQPFANRVMELVFRGGQVIEAEAELKKKG